MLLGKATDLVKQEEAGKARLVDDSNDVHAQLRHFREGHEDVRRAGGVQTCAHGKQWRTHKGAVRTVEIIICTDLHVRLWGIKQASRALCRLRAKSRRVVGMGM